jgi:S-DNA-T family DNA segregation ATPase FtsK/SpoIIIE
LSRLLFAPLAVALASVYASSHVPLSEWTHSFGLGGLFGDTVLGAILGVVPVSAVFGLKLMAFAVFLGLLALSVFVLGFSREELRTGARYAFVGVILTYAGLAKLLGAASRGAARSAVVVAQKASSARAARKEAHMVSGSEVDDQDDMPIEGPSLRRPPIVTASQTAPEPEMEIEPQPKPGLLARVPALVKRVTDPAPQVDLDEAVIHELDPEDRIKSRITDVIKNRARRVPVLEADTTPASMRAEPQLTRGRGPDPLYITPEASDEDALDDAAYYDAMPADVEVAPQMSAGRPLQTKPVVQQPVRKAPAPSTRAKAEAQPTLFDDKHSDFELPPLNLLANPANVERHVLSDEALEENARMLEAVLDDYGVKGEIVSVRPGPVVTMYELEPAPGLKASRVIGLADDIARSMSALSARVSTVPSSASSCPTRNARWSCYAKSSPPATLAMARKSCRWRWARTSAAKASWRTLPRCLTC